MLKMKMFKMLKTEKCQLTRRVGTEADPVILQLQQLFLIKITKMRNNKARNQSESLHKSY